MTGGRWVWDLESNGLLDTIHTVWCIVCRNIDTDEVREFGPDDIQSALDLLSGADEIIGHNIIGYDIPALQIVYPEWSTSAIVTDTLILSRLVRGDLFNDDAERNFTQERFPKRLWGSHSLKAWGLRLGDFKDDYDGGWDAFSDIMMSYCVQDTSTTATLYKHFVKQEPNPGAIAHEHRMAWICDEIGSNGWTFDEKKAAALYAKLAQKRHSIEEDLKELFEPWTVSEDFYPKRDNKTLGYKAGELFVKEKLVHFNPASRPHIHKCLVDKYQWKPKEFTASGAAKIDETILGKLAYPEAKRLAEFFTIQKRIGQLAEGNAAWLKKVSSDGKLRHRLIPNNTVSSRASSVAPNLQQVPRVGNPYGQECRELFTAPKGWFVTGSDLSGIELRCLSHYLFPYDRGEYAKQILEGDIHSYNAEAFKTDRNTAKTLIYSMTYGGGDRLVGAVAGGSPALGKKLKADFDQAVPAFATLKANLKQAFKRGYIIAIDGRKLTIRSEHRSLSQLLQSCGAIISAKWVQLTYDQIKQKHGDSNSFILGWIHDEIQIACRTEEIAKDVGDISKRMAQEAGRALGIKIPCAAEYSVGKSWAETH